MRSRNRRRKDGFTLIEVLLVLVILVILASFAVVQFTGVRQDRERPGGPDAGRSDQDRDTNVRDVGQQLSHRKLQALRTPPQDLPDPSKWAGPYLDHDIPPDPWGNPYQYAVPGNHNPRQFRRLVFRPRRRRRHAGRHRKLD